ncbi:MAG: ArsR family transcriptional regulator [Bacteroidales bacterium]|nr:ArsR family transcriptional regulator [Bacteroidales bacterium]MDD4604659.1 ArsR family transcriptional regulator [Bacteroidales bacterium]
MKLLIRFFLNPGSKSYLRGLEEEFGESTNAIRVELNRFEEAGLLTSEMSGNKKVFTANEGHPLYDDINSILRKHLGIDRLVEQVVDELGNVTRAYLVGDLAMGLDTRILDVVIVGKNIDLAFLEICLKKAESLIKREIHCFVVKETEEKRYLKDYPRTLLVWEKEKNGSTHHRS